MQLVIRVLNYPSPVVDWEVDTPHPSPITPLLSDRAFFIMPWRSGFVPDVGCERPARRRQIQKQSTADTELGRYRKLKMI